MEHNEKDETMEPVTESSTTTNSSSIMLKIRIQSQIRGCKGCKNLFFKLFQFSNFSHQYRRRSMATQLNFLRGQTLTPTDPHTHPVTIVGQLEHLKTFGSYDKVKVKLGDRVSEEHYTRALSALSPSPTDSVSLYLNYANVVALPEAGSRHNAPSRSHVFTKAVKSALSCTTEEGLVVIAPYSHLIPLTAALARAFPLYNRKTKDPESKHVLNVEYIVTDGELDEEDMTTLETVSFSVRHAARIVDTPCNELGVGDFIKECDTVLNKLTPERQVIMETIQGDELVNRGFGGIYNVGKGSSPDRQPALVVLKYDCKEDGAKSVAWVGKGIVFDTGGLTIKGRAGMCTMKMDCGGAAGVLYAFYLAVKLGIKCNLSAVLCLAENSVSAEAMRVDDVIQLYSGKTVEVNNTDAEGRLVLGDGVAYAKKDLQSEIIVDVATLTGAQKIATGKYHGAIVTNNEDYETLFMKAGKFSGDLAFPLPFTPELHFSEFKSEVADMKNSVNDGANASASCAGLFIFSHIGFDWEGVWVHIDMAGPKKDGNDRATGYGVLLLNYAFENSSKLFEKSSLYLQKK